MWDSIELVGSRNFFGPDLVGEAEDQVRLIHANLKAAQYRQKSYADKRRWPLIFEVGDRVYLRVSLMKGVQRFGVREKLAPRYVGPFPIVERCGPVAYRVELPSHLSAVHNIFHVSQLKKCLRVPTEAVEMENLQLEPDLVYPEHLVKIVDHKTRVTRNQTSSFYKVQWSNHSEREATWETEIFLKTNYPEFLATHQGTQLTPPSAFQFNVRTPNLVTRFLLGGRIVTPGYSGHWPGYSGRGVSISIIWSSGPHNHLNRKYLSLPHSHSLPLPLSPSPPSRALPLP